MPSQLVWRGVSRDCSCAEDVLIATGGGRKAQPSSKQPGSRVRCGTGHCGASMHDGTPTKTNCAHCMSDEARRKRMGCVQSREAGGTLSTTAARTAVPGQAFVFRAACCRVGLHSGCRNGQSRACFRPRGLFIGEAGHWGRRRQQPRTRKCSARLPPPTNPPCRQAAALSVLLCPAAAVVIVACLTACLTALRSTSNCSCLRSRLAFRLCCWPYLARAMPFWATSFKHPRSGRGGQRRT